MKKIAIAAKLTAVLLCLSLIAGVASSAAAAEDPVIGKCFDAFEAAEPIFSELLEFVRDEIAAADEDDAEFNADEAEAMIKQLQNFAKKLDTLTSAIPPGDMDTGEGKTVKATRDYLTMLKNISGDMHELVKYSIEFVEAVMPMVEESESYENYEDLASEIYANTVASMEMLEKIKPPSYIAITHRDLLARVAEFQEFAADFYWAASMGDPLRIYSCVYRMARIDVMFTKCGDNLNADIELQLKQAERRLSGPISTLRDELSAAFAPLKSGKGG
ncbi:MAG: hypothetical protein FWD23_12670 [Oscillospiraceae bacterium]|nr:hypothetical protein [Oscillospiraceae bacterium]